MPNSFQNFLTSLPPGKSAQTHQRSSRFHISERARYGMVFILPSLVFFLIFIAWPLIHSFYLSFFDWSPLDPEPTFIGLANFQELFSSSEFLKIIGNTAFFTVGVVSLTVIGSLVLALALNQGLRGTSLFRAIFYSPVVTSFVATGVVWLWILDPQFGIVNQILRALGLHAPGWTSDINWSMPTVILTFSWREIGYFTVIYLAGLQGVPEELKEASRIDGSNAIGVFRYITFPLLMPTTLFVLVISTIRATQNAFGVIYVMTGGGPVNTTNVIVMYLYQNAFTFFRMGYASAIAYVLFVFILIATIIQFRVVGKRTEYY